MRDLRRNADENYVDIDVIGGDAARELPELGGLDALVVDPPRAGLADGVPADIAAARPGRVVYVSCNPATWARDVRRFEDVGYRWSAFSPSTCSRRPTTWSWSAASCAAKRQRGCAGAGRAMPAQRREAGHTRVASRGAWRMRGRLVRAEGC